MQPVKQTIHDSKTGNCVSACLASLLDVELDTVPNFLALHPTSTATMWETVRLWLRQTHNKSLVTFKSDALIAASHGTLLLAGGRSPNTKGFHCVVGTITDG